MTTNQQLAEIRITLAHLHELLHQHLDKAQDTGVLKLLRSIHHQGQLLMSAISDFADKMKLHTDHVDVAVEGLQADVAELNRQIAALQATAGTITPEDQALLDQIEARAAAIHEKLDALDALTPPVVPPTP